MGIVAGRWDFEKHRYFPYITPDEWFTPLVCDDMDKKINCPSCGKELPYGETFTSRTIHNDFGLGYPVCEDCYTKEREVESTCQPLNPAPKVANLTGATNATVSIATVMATMRTRKLSRRTRPLKPRLNRLK